MHFSVISNLDLTLRSHAASQIRRSSLLRQATSPLQLEGGMGVKADRQPGHRILEVASASHGNQDYQGDNRGNYVGFLIRILKQIHQLTSIINSQES